MGLDWVVYALIAAAVIGVAAAGVGAYSTIQAGKAQRKSADYNAAIMEKQADVQKKAAASRADDIRQRNRVMLAQDLALAGASGAAVEPGTSPLAVLAYNAREGELEALRTEWSGSSNSDATVEQARMYRIQGKNAQSASNLQAGTTLLGGLSSSGQTFAGGYAAYGRYS